MTFFVGVDGGGTRTRAVLLDGGGEELGRGEAEGAVVTTSRPEEAAEAVASAVRSATAQADVSLPAATLWAGLAGAGAAAARAGITRALRRLDLADRLVVGTDVEAAFHAAFGDGAGILLIAGTGSIAQARDVAGSEHRVGGWGHVLGDEGSGYALGMAGLRYLTRSADGRAPPTSMTRVLLDRCDAESVHDLVGWVEVASKREVAALAPLVVACADEGDGPASAIVDEGVEALCLHVEAVRGAMTSPGEEGATEAGAPDVVLWGGLVAPGGPLEGRVREALVVRGIRTVSRDVDPARGAAELARESGR